MSKKKHKELCLACEKNILPEILGDPGSSYSRYGDAWICSECGVREAFEGFFWTIRARAAGVRLNEGVEDIHD